MSCDIGVRNPNWTIMGDNIDWLSDDLHSLHLIFYTFHTLEQMNFGRYCVRSHGWNHKEIKWSDVNQCWRYSTVQYYNTVLWLSAYRATLWGSTNNNVFFFWHFVKYSYLTTSGIAPVLSHWVYDHSLTSTRPARSAFHPSQIYFNKKWEVLPHSKADPLS